MDWMYFFDNKTVLIWVKNMIFREGHCHIEVTVAKAMSNFWGRSSPQAQLQG